jgi:hypothetical protein
MSEFQNSSRLISQTLPIHLTIGIHGVFGMIAHVYWSIDSPPTIWRRLTLFWA